MKSIRHDLKAISISAQTVDNSINSTVRGLRAKTLGSLSVRERDRQGNGRGASGSEIFDQKFERRW